jgi:hypothetical protein
MVRHIYNILLQFYVLVRTCHVDFIEDRQHYDQKKKDRQHYDQKMKDRQHYDQKKKDKQRW